MTLNYAEPSFSPEGTVEAAAGGLAATASVTAYSVWILLVQFSSAVTRFVALGSRLLAAAEHAEDGAIENADVWDVSRPRRRGAGRGLVVGVARCSSGRRVGGDHSAVTSVTAARVDDSSTMALSAANAATRAWRATLLTARG